MSVPPRAQQQRASRARGEAPPAQHSPRVRPVPSAAGGAELGRTKPPCFHCNYRGRGPLRLSVALFPSRPAPLPPFCKRPPANTSRRGKTPGAPCGGPVLRAAPPYLRARSACQGRSGLRFAPILPWLRHALRAPLTPAPPPKRLRQTPSVFQPRRGRKGQGSRGRKE